MSSYIHYKVTCGCGHEGEITMQENDAPFSKQYEEYSVSDLNCVNKEYSVVGTFATMSQVIEHMKPSCPKCGVALTTKNVKS